MPKEPQRQIRIQFAMFLLLRFELLDGRDIRYVGHKTLSGVHYDQSLALLLIANRDNAVVVFREHVVLFREILHQVLYERVGFTLVCALPNLDIIHFIAEVFS